jgi:hypothetical protein
MVLVEIFQQTKLIILYPINMFLIERFSKVLNAHHQLGM